MKSYKRTYTLPFKFDIPNYTQDFINKNYLILAYFKFLKRSIYLILQNQSNLEIQKILPKHKKILWINLSAPSLGDSLMDLSCRILLKGRIIDLYTDKKNFHLFINDEVFNNVYSQAEELEKNSYDLVILDSYSTRTIKVKSNLMPLIPFVGMYGYFNGPEVNRVLFGFHRMNQLLEYAKNEEEINHSARALMSISKEDSQLVGNLKLPEEYISIAIGGEWVYRTYNNWEELIKQLIFRESQLKIVLVGSDNALRFSKELIKKIPSENLINCINKFSFTQTAEIINKSKCLICCDGGLMHAANALKTPILPLFARLTPQMQLTENIISFSLFDDEDVNNIEVSSILAQYVNLINYVHNHLQA